MVSQEGIAVYRIKSILAPDGRLQIEPCSLLHSSLISVPGGRRSVHRGKETIRGLYTCNYQIKGRMAMLYVQGAQSAAPAAVHHR